jgi:hypothetical protein
MVNSARGQGNHWVTRLTRRAGSLAALASYSADFANAVLKLAGLPSQLFQQTRIWLTTEEMRALYDAIAQLSGNPAIGFRLGSEERPENYSD